MGQEETQLAARLPDTDHEVIVVLETIHLNTPDFDTRPKTHEVISYKYQTSKDDVASKLQCASIVLTTTCPINAQTLGDAPFLKYVVARTTGTDHIDLDECKRRGITVINSPGATREVVSEHAISLYFATRRRLTILHNALHEIGDGGANSWKTEGSLAGRLRTSQAKPPPSCDQEVVGMIGHGVIGKRIAQLCHALGMKVLVAKRKNALNGGTGHDADGRIPFEDVLRQATVLMLALPLTTQSNDLIGEAELAMMRPETVIINISRGGIVNEHAVVEALQQGKVYGYGTDVFKVEPASGASDTILLSKEARGLNIVPTPHLAWFGQRTMENIWTLTKDNIESCAKGSPINVVV